MKVTSAKNTAPGSFSIREVLLMVLHWGVVIGLTLAVLSAQAANDLVLSDRPLFISNSTPSNVFFMVDDSGSMDFTILAEDHWHFTNYTQNAGAFGLVSGGIQFAYTDQIGDACRNDGITTNGPIGAQLRYVYGNQDNAYKGCPRSASVHNNRGMILRDWRLLTSQLNVLYYDPEQTYVPWPGMPPANFRQARSHPDASRPGYNMERDLAANGGFRFIVTSDTAGFNGTRPSAGAFTRGANGLVDLWDDHVVVTVKDNAITAERITYEGPFTACSGVAHLETPAYRSCLGAKREAVDWQSVLNTGRTVAQEQQNIANWYQYYRRRAFIPRAAIAEVVRSVPSLRYGISMINNYGDLFVPFPASDANFAVHNQNLVDALFAYPQQVANTPLRRALERAGEYYSGNLSGVADPFTSQCQQSFALLLSDGYWNGGDPSGAIGDSDGDSVDRTLADVAHYYYDKDLSPLPNEVPVREQCEASASDATQTNASQTKAVCDAKSTQHMVTFTLAFGVEGQLVDTDGDGWPNPFITESDDWGNPNTSPSAKIDDLWHAAYNSRGAYISAKTPAQVRDGLVDAINTINARKSSGTAVSINAGSISSETLVFAASFDPADWSGDLQAQSVDLATGLLDETLWSAKEKLADQDPDSRQVITYRADSDRGVAFQWPKNAQSPAANELSADQVSALLRYRESQPEDAYGQALVNYLRGDRSRESTTAGTSPSEIAFRARTSVLADIVDSDPVFVGRPGRRYPDQWGEGQPENDAPYSEFRKIERTPMVYVGSNGGMLHGFGATAQGSLAGEERLAYIPASVFDRLPNLAQPSYVHEYFVNGSPVAEDVYFSRGSEEDQGWRTILVGGLGAGGQSIYALDVTDPSRFDEDQAEDIVLWEFSDPDLGYTFGEPAIGRLPNGRWAVFFGSGINNTQPDGEASEAGNAYLFIVDAQTGELIAKFDTRVGVEKDPLDQGRPNALWTPALVDANNDFIVDMVFAGDLFGNLWQWNLSGDAVSDWAFAPTAAEPIPLFRARNAQGIVQPITTRPEVGFHNGKTEFLVYFGTGQYLTVNDNLVTDAPVQSFYAVSTDTSLTLTRSALQGQTIEAEFNVVGGLDLRQTTNRPVDWQSQKGWYLDFTAPGSPTNSRGERIVQRPILRGGKVIFPTLIPAGDACTSGGSGWIMELDARTGARLQRPPIDVNNDGAINAEDRLPLSEDQVVFPSGFSDATGGIPERPAILLESQRREKKFIGQSSGRILTITEDPGGDRVGRQSWRQIQ